MLLQKLRPGINPIIIKELRSTMRGMRAFATLTVALLLLGGVSYALYRMVVTTAQYSNAPLSPQVGQTLFTGLIFFTLLMICVVTPAVTASAISGEQEKLTYEMLLATPLRPTSILWGKLVSALGYVFLLLFAAVPMASLVFIFGGVSPRDMLKALLILLVSAVMIGVIGLFFSSLFRRSGRATVVSYLTVAALLFTPTVLAVVFGILRQSEPPRWLLIPSPVNALFSAVQPSMNNPGGSIFWMLGGNLWNMGAAPVSQTGIPRPLYHYSLPFFAGLTLVLYLLTTRLVQPARRWRIHWKEALVGAGLVALLVGAVTGFFWLTRNRYPGASIFAKPVPMGGAPERGVVVVEKAVPVPAIVAVAPTATPTDPLGEAEKAEMYAAVIFQLYAIEQPGTTFSQIYLVSHTDDSVGDPNVPAGETQLIPESLQKAVVTTLEDWEERQVSYQWVESQKEVPLDRDGAIAGPGAVITLGNVQFSEDQASIAVSMYVANLNAKGKTYTLEKVDGAWEVTGTTGVEWQS